MGTHHLIPSRETIYEDMYYILENRTVVEYENELFDDKGLCSCLQDIEINIFARIEHSIDSPEYLEYLFTIYKAQGINNLISDIIRLSKISDRDVDILAALIGSSDIDDVHLIKFKMTLVHGAFVPRVIELYFIYTIHLIDYNYYNNRRKHLLKHFAEDDYCFIWIMIQMLFMWDTHSVNDYINGRIWGNATSIKMLIRIVKTLFPDYDLNVLKHMAVLAKPGTNGFDEVLTRKLQPNITKHARAQLYVKWINSE
jgi:hypothetical protein